MQRPMHIITLFIFTLLLSSITHAAKENFDRSKPHVKIAASVNGLSIGNITGIQGVSIRATDDASNQTGQPVYGNITFEMAYTGDDSDTQLIEWVKQASIEGSKCRDCRRDILVSIVNRNGEINNQINVISAFPIKYEIKSTRTKKGTVLFIEFTLIPDRIEFKKA